MSQEQAVPVGKPPSKAGRNLPAAIAVGVGLGAIIIASLAFYKYLFVVVVTAAVVIAVWELHNAFLRNDIRIARTPLYIVALVGSVVLGFVMHHNDVFGDEGMSRFRSRFGQRRRRF